MLESYLVEVVQQVLVVVLATEDINLVVGQGSRMAVTRRRHVTLVLALEPPKHLELTFPVFQLLSVSHLACVRVKLDFALRLVYFLVQANQNVCVVEALRVVVDSSVYQHFVPFDQDSYVSFARRGLVARVRQRLQFSPYFALHAILVQVAKALAVVAASRDE